MVAWLLLGNNWKIQREHAPVGFLLYTDKYLHISDKQRKILDGVFKKYSVVFPIRGDQANS
jgi:hypothetical protein